jgi:hypothetical protein
VQTKFPLFISAMGCENILLDSLVFSDAGAIVSSAFHKDTIQSGHTDTVWTTLEGLYPGTRTLNIHGFLYRFGDQVLFDTTVAINITVSGANNEPLVAVAPTFDLSNCVTSLVPVVLHAPCDSLTITDAALTIDSKLHYTTNLTFPQPLSANDFDTLTIAFPPQGLNTTTNISARIRGQFGGTFTTFDTTVRTIVKFSCAGVSETPQTIGINLTSIQTIGDKLHFIITANDANFDACDAEIVSVLGDVVARRTLPLVANDNAMEWNLSGLPAGEYFLRVAREDYRASRKFVIVR